MYIVKSDQLVIICITGLDWVDIWWLFPVYAIKQGDLCKMFKVGEFTNWDKLGKDSFEDV